MFADVTELHEIKDGVDSNMGAYYSRSSNMGATCVDYHKLALSYINKTESQQSCLAISSLDQSHIQQ